MSPFKDFQAVEPYAARFGLAFQLDCKGAGRFSGLAAR
jgi:hypothetical protein